MPTDKMICFSCGDVDYCWNIKKCCWQRYETKTIIDVKDIDVSNVPTEAYKKIMCEINKIIEGKKQNEP